MSQPPGELLPEPLADDNPPAPHLPVEWPEPDDSDAELGKVLSDLEENQEQPLQRSEFVQVLRTIQVRRSGPLPAPEELAQYNAVIPGAAERIVAMAEREQAHRHEMEKGDQGLAAQAEDHDYRITQRGQLFGLGICLAVLVTASILALTGHGAIAAVLVGLDLVGLAAVFVIGRVLPSQSRPDDRSIDPSSEPDSPAITEGS